MELRFCPRCEAAKPVLAPHDYTRLRLLHQRLTRKPFDPRARTVEEQMEPLFRMYEQITGERETSWVHIIVHQLWWQPAADPANDDE